MTAATSERRPPPPDTARNHPIRNGGQPTKGLPAVVAAVRCTGRSLIRRASPRRFRLFRGRFRPRWSPDCPPLDGQPVEENRTVTDCEVHRQLLAPFEHCGAGVELREGALLREAAGTDVKRDTVGRLRHEQQRHLPAPGREALLRRAALEAVGRQVDRAAVAGRARGLNRGGIDRGILDRILHHQAVHGVAEVERNGQLAAHLHAPGRGHQQVARRILPHRKVEAAAIERPGRVAGGKVDRRALGGKIQVAPAEGRGAERVLERTRGAAAAGQKGKAVARSERPAAVGIELRGAREGPDVGLKGDYALPGRGRLVRFAAAGCSEEGRQGGRTAYCNSFHVFHVV